MCRVGMKTCTGCKLMTAQMGWHTLLYLGSLVAWFLLGPMSVSAHAANQGNSHSMRCICLSPTKVTTVTLPPKQPVIPPDPCKVWTSTPHPPTPLPSLPPPLPVRTPAPPTHSNSDQQASPHPPTHPPALNTRQPCCARTTMQCSTHAPPLRPCCAATAMQLPSSYPKEIPATQPHPGPSRLAASQPAWPSPDLPGTAPPQMT
ncbi:hypothetical protein V8C86DRAFT_866812 [Haematococcus lacustris]